MKDPRLRGVFGQAALLGSVSTCITEGEPGLGSGETCRGKLGRGRKLQPGCVEKCLTADPGVTVPVSHVRGMFVCERPGHPRKLYGV